MPTNEPDRTGDACDEWTGDDVGCLALGRRRGELSRGATLFRHGDPVGQPVLAVLSNLLVSERGGLPLAGDEVVVTKAGKATHGLDRFFASLYGKPVPGLAFFALALVSVQGV